MDKIRSKAGTISKILVAAVVVIVAVFGTSFVFLLNSIFAEVGNTASILSLDGLMYFMLDAFFFIFVILGALMTVRGRR